MNKAGLLQVQPTGLVVAMTRLYLFLSLSCFMHHELAMAQINGGIIIHPNIRVTDLSSSSLSARQRTLFCHTSVPSEYGKVLQTLYSWHFRSEQSSSLSQSQSLIFVPKSVNDTGKYICRVTLLLGRNRSVVVVPEAVVLPVPIPMDWSAFEERRETRIAGDGATSLNGQDLTVIHSTPSAKSQSESKTWVVERMTFSDYFNIDLIVVNNASEFNCAIMPFFTRPGVGAQSCTNMISTSVVYAEVGQDVLFDCNATSNYEVISYYAITNTGAGLLMPTPTLEIKSVTKSNRGNYTCIASTGRAFNHHTFTLIVTEPSTTSTESINSTDVHSSPRRQVSISTGTLYIPTTKPPPKNTPPSTTTPELINSTDVHSSPRRQVSISTGTWYTPTTKPPPKNTTPSTTTPELTRSTDVHSSSMLPAQATSPLKRTNTSAYVAMAYVLGGIIAALGILVTISVCRRYKKAKGSSGEYSPDREQGFEKKPIQAVVAAGARSHHRSCLESTAPARSTNTLLSSQMWPAMSEPGERQVTPIFSNDDTFQFVSEADIAKALVQSTPDFVGSLQEPENGNVAKQTELPNRFTAVESRTDHLGGLVQSLEIPNSKILETLEQKCLGTDAPVPLLQVSEMCEVMLCVTREERQAEARKNNAALADLPEDGSEDVFGVVKGPLPDIAGEVLSAKRLGQPRGAGQSTVQQEAGESTPDPAPRANRPLPVLLELAVRGKSMLWERHRDLKHKNLPVYMSNPWKSRAYLQWYPKLINVMHPSQVTVLCFSLQLLDDYEMEEIDAKPTRHAKNSAILAVLSSSPEKFGRFREVLDHLNGLGLKGIVEDLDKLGQDREKDRDCLDARRILET